MGQLAITVNGRRYDISCDDGEEDRASRLGQELNARVMSLAASVGQVGEARLLLLAALTLQDELAEANRRLAEEWASSRDGALTDTGVRTPAGDRVLTAGEALASDLDGLIERIEAVADRLKAP